MTQIGSSDVSAPDGLTMTQGDSPQSFRIGRRWLRPKHALYFAGVVAAGLFLSPRWALVVDGTMRADTGLMVASFFVLMFTIRLVGVVFNRTTVKLEGDTLTVTHGPLPSIVAQPATISRAETQEFRAQPAGSLYEVVAVAPDGSTKVAVRPLVTLRQATFIRDQLHAAWSLTFGGSYQKPDDVTPDAGSTAPAWLRLLVPVGIVGILALFYFNIASQVEGTGRIGDGPGASEFTPTDCRSGVPRGFYGVELMSESAPGTIVRVVRPPTGVPMIVVQHGDQAPELFGADTCEELHITVAPTGNVVNTVQALRGSAHARCAGVSLDVEFDGCH